jgi:hypothetical protein
MDAAPFMTDVLFASWMADGLLKKLRLRKHKTGHFFNRERLIIQGLFCRWPWCGIKIDMIRVHSGLPIPISISS